MMATNVSVRVHNENTPTPHVSFAFVTGYDVKAYFTVYTNQDGTLEVYTTGTLCVAPVPYPAAAVTIAQIRE